MTNLTWNRSSKSYLWLVILLGIGIAQGCKNKNRPSTDEGTLTKSILEEEALKQKGNLASGQENPNSFSNSTVGLRLKEERSVDPGNPPVLLDVIASRDNIREFKLSDMVSSVRYVKLETPPDTNLLLGGLDLYFTGNGIVTKGLWGLTHFSMDGKFIEVICSNRVDVKMYPSGLSYSSQSFIGNPTYSGISIHNGKIFYRYDKVGDKESSVLSYQLSDEQNIQFDVPENQEQMYGKGNVLTELEYKNWSRVGDILAIGDKQWIDLNPKWGSGATGTLMVNYSEQGDTLCVFSDNDRIVNFSSEMFRGAEEAIHYYYNGTLTLKAAYNDTLFRVVSSNRMLPVYVINFGSNKPSHMEGLNPKFDLTDKFLCRSINETKDWIFFEYTQNVVSLATRKNKTVKFHYTLFNKQNSTLTHFPDGTSMEIGIENDLDGGNPFWPDYVTPSGELVMFVNGKEFRDYINSSDFEQRNIPKDQRDIQVRMANSLKDNDQVLMFAE